MTNGTPDQGNGGNRLGTGLRLLREGHIVRGRDVNPAITLCMAFAKLMVKRIPALPDDAGNYTNDARFNLGDLGALIELIDAPSTINQTGGGSGTANIVAMQVVSAPSGTNDYFSAKLGSFSGGVFTATGSAIDVALPWELRNAQNPGTGYNIFPAYATNDIVFALATSAGQNGVIVSGSELTYMDFGLNRTWQGAQCQYLGTYSNVATYYPGNIVRVQSGSSQGVWVRVGTGPTTGSDPVFPEPSTTGGTNVWEMWTFGVFTQSVCVSGSTKTQYINATAAS